MMHLVDKAVSDALAKGELEVARGVSPRSLSPGCPANKSLPEAARRRCSETTLASPDICIHILKSMNFALFPAIEVSMFHETMTKDTCNGC